jgi:hypothetical protein
MGILFGGEIFEALLWIHFAIAGLCHTKKPIRK